MALEAQSDNSQVSAETSIHMLASDYGLKWRFRNRSRRELVDQKEHKLVHTEQELPDSVDFQVGEIACGAVQRKRKSSGYSSYGRWKACEHEESADEQERSIYG